MSVFINELRHHLQAFDFRSLFVESLGWATTQPSRSTSR